MTLLMMSVLFLACEDSVLAESEKVAVPNTQTCPYYSLANELACSEKTYKTVVIGSQIWMAENLNFGVYLEKWDVLVKYLGGDDYPDQVAEKLRALSYNGKDEVGFSSLGSGSRESYGDFRYREGKTAFWMTKEENSDAAFYRGIWYGNGFLAYFSTYKKSGFSIRCLKN